MQPSSRLRFFVFAAACLGLVGSGITATATAADAAADVTFDDVRAGFDGYYKVGDWSPVFVTVTSAADREAQLVVGVPDVDSDMTWRTGPTVQLKAGQPYRFESRFKTGRTRGELHLRIDSGGERVATKTLRVGENSAAFREGLLPAQQLWVSVGEPAGLTNDDAQDSQDQTRFVADIPPEDLPSEWRSYDGVDALIIATAVTDGEPIPARITDAQSSAIALWVRCGGFLAVSLGREVNSYQKSPLATWMPVKVTGQADTRELRDVESIAGQRDPLPRFRPLKTAVISEDPADFDGEVVARGLSGPRLVRVPYGLGRIAFLTVDANLPPIQGWKAAAALMEQVVDGAGNVTQRNPQSSSGKLSSIGITDLLSQLQAIQQDMEGVPKPSVWTVLGLLVLYMLLIGPLDFWLVHKLLKRPELTWLTFPAMVALACGLAIWTSTALHAKTVQVKQTSLVDIDSGTDQLFVRTWSSLYSPHNAKYDVTAQAGAFAGTSPADVSLSWNALAEDAIGGLNRQGGIHLTNRSYDYGSDGNTLDGLPIGHWSAKMLSTQWQQTHRGLITNELETPGSGRIRGRISHAFPVPLYDCVLAYGGQAYRIDKLAPYQQWMPSPSQSREIRSFLTGVVAKQKTLNEDVSLDQFFEERATYNPLERNIDQVVRMLTFHETAGGASYSGMAHDVCPELDYTRHIRLGRAVLLGAAELPATDLLVDGQPVENTTRRTFVRIVLPVKKVAAAENFRVLPLPKRDAPIRDDDDR